MSGSIFQELKRRNVFRVAVIYLVVSWLLMQVGDVMFPALRLPEWTITMLVAFLMLGFPFAMIFAWAYEITADGVQRTDDVLDEQSILPDTGQKFNRLIVTVLALAVVVLLVRAYVVEPSPTPIPQTMENSIAVLPFKNRSASTENAEFFAAGVHDELLTLLSKIGGFKVISRTSVERLSPDLSIPEIGELLGVATILEGQVQRAGDRLRINVQLIRTTEEDHLWATTYDRELTASNIFDVQSDIARSIADELHVQLSANDDTLLRTVPTDDIEALQSYMLARQRLNHGTFESNEKAVAYLEKAVEMDPDYAEAWAALAHAYNRKYQTGQIGLQEYEVAATPAIARALEINDRLAEAHGELATLRWQTGDIVAAESSFRTALEIGPSDSQSLASYGQYLGSTGRPRDAIPIFRSALESDPLSATIIYRLGVAEMHAGQPEQFIARGKKILEIDPSSISGYAAHIQAYFWMGRYDLMWPWYMKAMESDPADYELWAHLGLFLQHLGATELADKYLQLAMQMGPEEPTVLRCYAGALVDRGQHDEALEIAKFALQKNLSDRWQSQETFLRIVRDAALQSGNPEESRSLYLSLYPELFSEVPEISVKNVNVAADLALLLQRGGESRAAEVIIEAGLAWFRRTQPPNVYGFLIEIVDVEFLALSGQKQAALEALQQAVDSGWNSNWQSIFRNETLASLRDDPQFKKITAQLEDEMARQLGVIRALPHLSEFDLRN